MIPALTIDVSEGGTLELAHVPRQALQVLDLTGTGARFRALGCPRSGDYTGAQVDIAEQGQYTARFNDATTNLGSKEREVRIGGIHALDRIMRDSEKDQPRVIAVLTSYIREKSAVPMTGEFKELSGRIEEQKPDISAVVFILATRSAAKGVRAQVDLSYADLHGLNLTPYRVDETQRLLTEGDKGVPPPCLGLGPVNLEHADVRFAPHRQIQSRPLVLAIR
ncbi:hypothetical protein [Streptomyces sp. NPDC001594]|uniref:hypothetical protein n=1 Tax=Streptomyces sp. NPDC001594 TaxID=3364590 RepID=UPI0036922200